MAKSDSAKLYINMGMIIALVGVVILILTLLNYFQDGRVVSSTLLMGVIIVVLGVFFYTSGKKLKAQEK